MKPRPAFSLSVDRHTPVLVQGITGRAGQRHACMMRDAGTAIVAGVSARADAGPGDGIPGFADCASAVAATGAPAGRGACVSGNERHGCSGAGIRSGRSRAATNHTPRVTVTA